MNTTTTTIATLIIHMAAALDAMADHGDERRREAEAALGISEQPGDEPDTKAAVQRLADLYTGIVQSYDAVIRELEERHAGRVRQKGYDVPILVSSLRVEQSVAGLMRPRWQREHALTWREVAAILDLDEPASTMREGATS